MRSDFKTDRRGLLTLALGAAGGVLSACRPPAAARADVARVRVERVPGGGLQPQLLADSRGGLHLVYLQGTPSACDVYYARREPGAAGWAAPVRVNSQAGSAVATGTIRGAQIALGKDDRVHVVWNGSMQAAGGGSREAPLCYTRAKDGGSGFEPQRNAMGRTVGLDGGASIAADRSGNVYLAWHAGERIGGGEGARRLWLARSTDEGRTFGAETGVFEDPTGACACCSVKAFADSRARLWLLYRAATEKVNRDMVLLSGAAAGPYRGGRIDPWVIGACPMSSETFAEGPDGVWAAWETDGQIRFGRVDPAGKVAGSPLSAPGSAAGRKHPFIAVNRAGEVLLVWDEGTGWQRGGALAWQLYDAKGKPLPETGRLEGGIPVWGLATAAALPDGSFLILH
jgi:hypothetical protein